MSEIKTMIAIVCAIVVLALVVMKLVIGAAIFFGALNRLGNCRVHQDTAA